MTTSEPPMPSAPPPPPPPAPTPQWRSLQGLETALTWLLALNGAASVFALYALARRLGVVNDLIDGERGLAVQRRFLDADDLVEAAGYTILGLVIATGIVFIVWNWRAAKNNEALGRQQPRLTTGWAITGWLIPLANFVIPVLVMQDLWRGSDSSVARGDIRWKIADRSALVGWWWALVLLSLLRGTADLDDPSTTFRQLRTHDTLTLVGMGFRVGAVVLAILVVRKITERQATCLKVQQEQWTGATQPPPPPEPLAPPPAT